MASLLSLCEVITLCCVLAQSGNSGSFFDNKNAKFDGEQEKESIICVKVGL